MLNRFIQSMFNNNRGSNNNLTATNDNHGTTVTITRPMATNKNVKANNNGTSNNNYQVSVTEAIAYNASASIFLIFPVELLGVIMSLLSPLDKKVFSQVCKKLFSVFISTDDKINQRLQINTLFQIKNDDKYNKENLHQLVSHARLGEWVQAKAIWSKDPVLLTLGGSVYFPNRSTNGIDISNWQNPGRSKITGTAWQIALMNEEYNEAKKMAKMMTLGDKQRQFLEIFPTGQIEHYNNKLPMAKMLLDYAFEAIINDELITEKNFEKMNEKTKKALCDLYDFLMPAPEHKIGLVFDVSIFIYALEKYDKGFFQFTRSNHWDQRSFWCIRIEEYMATLLPTAYLRPHAQGPNNFLDIHGHINTKLIKLDGCTLADGTSYFAFRRQSDSVPGAHHFVEQYGYPKKLVNKSRPPVTFFQNLCRIKADKERNLFNSLSQRSVVKRLQ